MIKENDLGCCLVRW